MPEHATPRGQAVVTAAVGAGTWILGSIVFSLAAGGAWYALNTAWFALAIVGWRTLIWLALVVLVTWVFRASPARRRAGLYVVAAVVAVLLEQLIAFVPSVAAGQAGSVLFFLGLPTVVGGLTFGTSAAVGAVAGLDLGTDARRWGEQAPRVVAVALVVLGGVLALALPVFWFSTSVAILGPGKTPTEAEGMQYLVVAILALGCGIGATVIGVVTRSRRIRTWGIVLLVLSLVFGVLFEVPPGRFWPDSGGSGYTQVPGGNSDCQADASKPGCGG